MPARLLPTRGFSTNTVAGYLLTRGFGSGFGAGTPDAAITWAVTADFDRDGTYETDLTAYVTKPGQGVAIDRGLNEEGFQRASRVSLALLNNDARFTAGNSAGAYYGDMDPGVPIRITATHNGTPYTLWTGYAQKWSRSWRSGQVPMVRLDCWDIGAYLADSPEINVTVSTTRDTDGAITAIATALGLSAGDLSLDDGIQDLPFHYCQAQKAMEALMAAVRSEMGGWLWINASGQIRFESRASRLGISPVDDTWGDGTGIFPIAIEELTDDLDFVTEVSARATIYATGQADQEVFRIVSRSASQPSDNSIAIAAGATYDRVFSGGQGISAFTTPESDTDYLANDSADGSGTDRTSLLTVTLTDYGGGRFRIQLKNTHSGTIYVTKFRLRGTMTAFYADRPEALVSLARTDLPAGRGVKLDVPFGGDATYQLVEWAMTILRANRYVNPRLKLTFHANNDIKRTAMLSLELGQLIRYTDTGITTQGSYSEDWYYVEGLKQHIPPDWAGEDFLTEVTLTPSYVFRNLDAIAFDDFTRANASGDLGTSTNGKTWANDTGFDIASNVARANTDTLSMATINLGTGITDQVVEVQIAAIGAGDEVGVVLRYADANNQYRVYLDKGSNEVILEKNVATVVTEIASPAFTVGTSHEMRVIIQGTRIRVWVDFELVIDTTDAGLSAGTSVGLFARTANATATFDNWYGQGLDAA